ncbi:hypothetical protein H6F96_01890 [Microcoleus sp. FACHB-53]|nr:hypothetical protein [Microcoleus sp. FACHB-53]
MSTDCRFWMQGFWGLRDTGGRDIDENVTVQNQPVKIPNRQIICITPYYFGGKS